MKLDGGFMMVFLRAARSGATFAASKNVPSESEFMPFAC
jgi:hypothetical protein